MTNLPEPRDLFRGALTECITHNPDSIEYIVLLMAFYLHVGPFSREVIGRLENVMAALNATRIKAFDVTVLPGRARYARSCDSHSDNIAGSTR